jgi:hypothetical protein
MEEKLSKGDIIRSPRGYLARVNWDDGVMVGVSFIEASFPSLACMTYKKEEVFVVKRGPQQFWKELFKKISDEGLREEIKQERALRAVTPTQEQKVVRKRDNVKSLLKELTQEDQKALVEMLRERRKE